MNSPRCRIIPLPQGRVAFEIDGKEVTRWHAQDRFATDAPRPYFSPLIGPSGDSVTRMGHPGAPNHDHHRSVWFAHHKVLGDPGISFWSDNTDARIRQAQWLCYRDGNDECIAASELHWLDGHNPKPLMAQQLVAAVRPGKPGWFLELQATFTPQAESMDLAKTNFGILGVRVAKNISAHFGGGTISDSEGRTGEPAIFGKAARWMDYSGKAAGDKTEGITLFDHPSNPNHPAKWHVREDGWMGPSLCRDAGITLRRDKPLRLRYLLFIHADAHDQKRWQTIFDAFSRSKPFSVTKSKRKHQAWDVSR